jgi:hypothetical protein
VAIDELGRVVPLHKVRYLNPADQVLEEMFAGWRLQQVSRNLALPTIDGRERLVRRFMAHSDEMPWRWTVQHVDEFFGYCPAATVSAGSAEIVRESSPHWIAPAAVRKANATEAESAPAARSGTTSPNC